MLKKIVSGGQTGVDQAALRAAKVVGIETGGWAPREWRTENGPEERLLRSYGLSEHESVSYNSRTLSNVRDSDATLICVHLKPLTGGTRKTVEFCGSLGRQWLAVEFLDEFSDEERATYITNWIELNGFEVLNVAGPRESKIPGIGARTERFLKVLFEMARGQETATARHNR